jgi:hypothetical protein
VVAKAAPDGYTLVYGSVTHSIAPALYKDKMPFDAVKDFTPVSQVATFPFVLVAHPALKVSSVKALVEEAKAAPGKLNYASVGNGTGTNLAGEMLKLLTGTNIVHVPYNGSGPALTALLGKQVDFAISDTPPAMPHIKSGALRAGRHHAAARRLAAGRADARRGRCAGLRVHVLVGRVRPGQSAAGDRAAAEPGIRQGAQAAGREGEPGIVLGRARRQLAGRVRRHREVRGGEVRQAGQGGRHPHRLIP